MDEATTSPELLRKTALELYELDFDNDTVGIPDVMPHESRELFGHQLEACDLIRAFGGIVISAGQNGYSVFSNQGEARQLVLPFSSSQNTINIRDYDPGLAQRMKHPDIKDRIFAGPYVASGLYWPNAVRLWEVINSETTDKE